MNLAATIKQYLELTGGYGRPAALSGFGVDRAEVEKAFSAFDEDYQISRYFHFDSGDGVAHRINGFEYTHVSIDAEIESIL